MRWIAIVVSTTQDFHHLSDNAQVFDFSLSAGQMQAIDALDRHRRFNDPGHFCEKAFNTFFPIFD